MATYKINPWESYPKDKRLAIMHAAILTSADDAYLYSTRYFQFGGIVDKNLHYFYKTTNQDDITSKRYVFYEIPQNKYDENNEHHYKVEGPFAHLGIGTYNAGTFTYNGKLTNPSGNVNSGENVEYVSGTNILKKVSGVSNKTFENINNYEYVGTTSVPNFVTYSGKEQVRNLLNIVNKVGDSAGRDLLFNANWGRARPLGNVKYFDGDRARVPGEIGNPWNAFSINTLKSRYAESVTEFVEWIGSDELHNDGPTSYPSGHSSQYWAMAMCIAQLYGREDFKNGNSNDGNYNSINIIRKAVHNAYKIGIGRTIARFHWNSDTLYGKLLGSMVMPILNASYDKAPNSGGSGYLYFDELFNNSSNELFHNSTYYVNNINNLRQIDNSSNNTWATWYEDFKKLILIFFKDESGWPLNNANIRDITTKSISTINTTTNDLDYMLYRYLWDMYKLGREEIADSGNYTHNFHFFDNSATDPEDSYNDEEQKNWFPEFFDTFCKNGYKINGKTYKYHGDNTEYRKGTNSIKSIINSSNNLQSHEILCSWLIGLCLSELYINTRTTGTLTDDNINNQTKIMALAYKIGGGRELNLYDEYKMDHDPMYLRFAAGIIYAYNRGKYSYSFIDSIRKTDTLIKLDTNKSNSIDPIEADDALLTEADRQDTVSTMRNDGYISTDKNVYGIDTYFIFPNAPGPYINGRKLSKPYEANTAKPGTKFFSNQCQDKSLFYTGSTSSGGSGNGNTSGNETDVYVTLKLVNNTGVDIPITGEINIYFKALDGSPTHESLSMILDGVSWSNHSSYIDKQNANGTFTQKSFKAGSNLTYENTKLIYGKNNTNGNHPSLYLGKTLNPECAIYVPSTKYGHVTEYVTATAAFESPTTTLTNGCTIVLTATKYENPTDNGVS